MVVAHPSDSERLTKNGLESDPPTVVALGNSRRFMAGLAQVRAMCVSVLYECEQLTSTMGGGGLR